MAAECCGMWAARSHAFIQPHRPRNAAECGLWWHVHMHLHNPTDRGMLRNVGSGGTCTCIRTTPPTTECCGMWALEARYMHSHNPTDRGMLRNVGSGGTFTCIHTTPPTAECCGMWALEARSHAAQPHRPQNAAECGLWRHIQLGTRLGSPSVPPEFRMFDLAHTSTLF